MSAPQTGDCRGLTPVLGSRPASPPLRGVFASSAYFVNVKNAPYGARGDGVTDDRAAIQAALDSVPPGGGSVYVPPGDYRIGGALTITKDSTLFYGAGYGASIVRLMDGVKADALALPEPYNAVIDPTFYVSDVTISDLTLDGNLNPRPATGEEDYYAVFAGQTTNLVLTRLFIKNWQSDGFSISNGNAPNNNITVRDCRFDNIGRNGIHCGFINVGLVDDNYITNTPSQYWGGAAASGIDIEVEGNNEPGTFPFSPAPSPPNTNYVYNLTLSNNVIVRRLSTTAGDGIAIQPAYGPAVGVTISGNVISGHQAGIEATGSLGLYGMPAGINGLVVAGNWLSSDAGIAVLGNPLRLTGTDGTQVTGNVANDLNANGYFSAYGFVLLQSSTNATVSGNTIWLPSTPSVAKISNDTTLAVNNNTYQTYNSVLLDDDHTSTGVTTAGNIDNSAAARDTTAPTVSLSISDGAVLAASTPVTVTATDAGAGVAKVWFLINGLPQGYKSVAPYTWTVDPSVLQPGTHTLEAFAVDGSANLADPVSVSVTVPVPTFSVSPGTVNAGTTTTLTLTGTTTNWTDATSFTVSAGTVNSVVVTSSTSATLSFTAPGTAQTVTVGDGTASAAVVVQSAQVSFSATPTTVTAGVETNLTLSGTNTTWSDATRFATTGGILTNATVTSPTSASVTLLVLQPGTVSISDGMASAVVVVQSGSASFAASPATVLAGRHVTLTLLGTNTNWLTGVSVQAVRGVVLDVTVNDATHLTVVYAAPNTPAVEILTVGGVSTTLAVVAPDVPTPPRPDAAVDVPIVTMLDATSFWVSVVVAGYYRVQRTAATRVALVQQDSAHKGGTLFLLPGLYVGQVVYGTRHALTAIVAPMTADLAQKISDGTYG